MQLAQQGGLEGSLDRSSGCTPVYWCPKILHVIAKSMADHHSTCSSFSVPNLRRRKQLQPSPATRPLWCCACLLRLVMSTQLSRAATRWMSDSEIGRSYLSSAQSRTAAACAMHLEAATRNLYLKSGQAFSLFWKSWVSYVPLTICAVPKLVRVST